MNRTNLICLAGKHVLPLSCVAQPLGFDSYFRRSTSTAFHQLQGGGYTMNTDNKIHVSGGRRDLHKQLSSGVRDVNNLEHFPALPGSVTQGTGERGLERLSSSFKDAVETKLEAQAPTFNLEGYDDLSSSASPRISARPQLQQMGKPGRVVEEAPQQAAIPPANEEFHHPKQRMMRSSKSTSQEVPAAASTQDPFGIPEHINSFAILADEPAPPPAEDPACNCTEEPEFRGGDTEGFFRRFLKGAAKLSGRQCGRLVAKHPVATTAVAVVAVSAVRFLLLRRTR